jgi:hypothetical protein
VQTPDAFCIKKNKKLKMDYYQKLLCVIITYFFLINYTSAFQCPTNAVYMCYGLNENICGNYYEIGLYGLSYPCQWDFTEGFCISDYNVCEPTDNGGACCDNTRCFKADYMNQCSYMYYQNMDCLTACPNLLTTTSTTSTTSTTHILTTTTLCRKMDKKGRCKI